METVLVLNGTEIDAPVDDQERLMLDLAAGRIGRSQLIDWLIGTFNHSQSRCRPTLEINHRPWVSSYPSLKGFPVRGSTRISPPRPDSIFASRWARSRRAPSRSSPLSQSNSRAENGQFSPNGHRPSRRPRASIRSSISSTSGGKGWAPWIVRSLRGLSPYLQFGTGGPLFRPQQLARWPMKDCRSLSILNCDMRLRSSV